MTPPSQLPPVGSQLGVFGSKYDMAKDSELILDAVVAAGYGSVEGGTKAQPGFKAALDRRGLTFAAAHTSMSGLLDAKPLIEHMHAMESSDICNSGILEWQNRTAAMYRDSIAKLNQIGRELRKEGIRLHYHNHDFEFTERFDGRSGMDLLIEGLDPQACDLCIDVAWVLKGGDDPAAFLSRHADRIGYLHFKDFDDAGWIELGQGKVDFAAIMRVLPGMKQVRWVMIEQDKTAIDPKDSVAISRRYLKQSFGY